MRGDLLQIYRRLREAYGAAGWWPARTPFEVCLGAILTQNTSWANALKALRGLRARSRLSFSALQALSSAELQRELRPAGTFRVKARRVRAFLAMLSKAYGGRASRFRGAPPERLRAQLLEVKGIGPETADAIALYAGGHAFFVVDAYTRRVFERVGWLAGGESYASVRALFQERLPRDARLYGDYHAQIVRLAKEVCRKRPRCERCPIATLCERRGVGEVGD